MEITANDMGTQFYVESKDISLIQTISPIKILEAIEWDDDNGCFIHTNDERLKPLFIALHNWKIENGYK